MGCASGVLLFSTDLFFNLPQLDFIPFPTPLLERKHALLRFEECWCGTAVPRYFWSYFHRVESLVLIVENDGRAGNSWEVVESGRDPFSEIALSE